MSDILERARGLAAEVDMRNKTPIHITLPDKYREPLSGFLRLTKEYETVLPDLIAECEKWRRVAIEERAICNFYQDDYGGNLSWTEFDDKNKYLLQAEKELMG